jgi:hypothetical protein
MSDTQLCDYLIEFKNEKLLSIRRLVDFIFCKSKDDEMLIYLFDRI